MKRRTTSDVKIGTKSLGHKYPVVLQSMTNTDTSDVEATVEQIIELNQAGAEIVRITVNNDSTAKAVPAILEKVRKISDVPVVGDFHFNGNILLSKHPECAKALNKYRINPGNADEQNFREMVEIALKYDKPVRIGVNAGSVDQGILNEIIKKPSNFPHGNSRRLMSAEELIETAVIRSALQSAKEAEKIGLPENKIVLSAKMSDVQSMIRVYQSIAEQCDYVLHLGLTEAGMGNAGIISSSIALGTLLQKDIGDTIRVSLTPGPATPRTKEVEVGQMILQSLGIKNFRPKVISCPGCGRTGSDYFQRLTQSVNMYIDSNLEEWKVKYSGVEDLKIAVMGCAVNGPGESMHADIGISLPGKMEKPIAPVYIDGEYFCDLKGEGIEGKFFEVLEEYLEKRDTLKNLFSSI